MVLRSWALRPQKKSKSFCFRRSQLQKSGLTTPYFFENNAFPNSHHLKDLSHLHANCASSRTVFKSTYNSLLSYSSVKCSTGGERFLGARRGPSWLTGVPNSGASINHDLACLHCPLFDGAHFLGLDDF